MGIVVVIDINAPAERVWGALVDVEHWPDWTPTMTSVARIDTGAFGSGSSARIRQPRLGTLTWTVTEFTPGQSFVWEARRRGLTLVAGHSLRTGSAGTVHLTLALDQKGPVGRLLEPLTGRTVRRAVALEADGHKRCAETPA
ncbi:MAG: SRPBCC family protein [Acidimicrobiales bacterium]